MLLSVNNKRVKSGEEVMRITYQQLRAQYGGESKLHCETAI
jgi:hypothetical protein